MKHKQELIDILMADAKLRYEYADKEGNTCAIGGIAVKFGWSGKPLRGGYPGDKPNGRGIRYEIFARHNLAKAMRKAQEHFGLDVYQLQELQRTNDAHQEKYDRHQALKELVESWEEE